MPPNLSPGPLALALTRPLVRALAIAPIPKPQAPGNNTRHSTAKSPSPKKNPSSAHASTPLLGELCPSAIHFSLKYSIKKRHLKTFFKHSKMHIYMYWHYGCHVCPGCLKLPRLRRGCHGLFTAATFSTGATVSTASTCSTATTIDSGFFPLHIRVFGCPPSTEKNRRRKAIFGILAKVAILLF